MCMTDPIADMLTRIRNSIMAGHTSTDVPASAMKESLAGILADEGYINGYEKVADRKQGLLRIGIRYSASGDSVITGLERVSRPGRRMYVGSKEIPPVLGGLGISILSTSRGLLSGHKAKARGVGGELLANVW